MIGQAGGQRDAVVACRLQTAPVVAGDDLHRNDGVGAGPVDRGIGDQIALLHVLDVADHILGAPVVPAHSDIADYFDCFIGEEQVNNYDVYLVKGVRVKNILHEKLFYYNRFQWGISAKLLKLFLEMPKEKMQLQPLTYFWGEKFSPVITRQIISRLDS